MKGFFKSKGLKVNLWMIVVMSSGYSINDGFSMSEFTHCGTAG